MWLPRYGSATGSNVSRLVPGLYLTNALNELSVTTVRRPTEDGDRRYPAACWHVNLATAATRHQKRLCFEQDVELDYHLKPQEGTRGVWPINLVSIAPSNLQ